MIYIHCVSSSSSFAWCRVRIAQIIRKFIKKKKKFKQKKNLKK